MRAIVPFLVLVTTLSSCAGAAKRPGGNDSASSKSKLDLCHEAETTHSPPPTGCPETTATPQRTRRVVVIPRDSLPGGGMGTGMGGVGQAGGAVPGGILR